MFIGLVLVTKDLNGLFMVHIIHNKSDNIIIINLFFAVRQSFKLGKEVLSLLFVKSKAQAIQMVYKGMMARVFTKNNMGLTSPYGFWRHDFIGFRIAHHTMLVDTRFMGKGVRPNNSLVRWYRYASQTRYQLR